MTDEHDSGHANWPRKADAQKEYKIWFALMFQTLVNRTVLRYIYI